MRIRQMVRADSDDKEPLVQYHPYKRHFLVFRMSEHAWLEIKPDVVESILPIISESPHTLCVMRNLNTLIHQSATSLLRDVGETRSCASN